MYEYVGEKLINFQHINYIYFLFPLMLQIWHPTQNEGKIPGAGQAEREEEEGSRQENNPCGPCLVRTCVNPILSEQEIRKKISSQEAEWGGCRPKYAKLHAPARLDGQRRRETEQSQTIPSHQPGKK